jgi:ferredoxin-NADP reductase
MAIPEGRLLTLDVPGWTGNLPGQHLDLRLTAEDGYQAVRSYSMASYGPTTRVELAVDRLPDGEVSPYLVDDVAPGDQFEVMGRSGSTSSGGQPNSSRFSWWPAARAWYR